MMGRPFFLAVLATAFTATACAPREVSSDSKASELEVTAELTDSKNNQAPKEASALLQKVRAEDYRSWTRAPGYEQRQPAASPHSDEVDIYVNDVVAKALADGKPLSEWPEGATIVKDGFSKSKLELTAILDKRADGWFWAEYFGDKPAFSGKPSACTGCHAGGDDFVLAFPLPQAPKP